MENLNDIVSIIYEAIDEINQLLPEDGKLEKSPDTVLFDKDGKLDSLGMVNLVVALEEAIEDKFDVSLSLANALTNPQDDNNYFENISSLAGFIFSNLTGD